MKRLYFLLSVCFLTIMCYAQSIHFGIRGGLNISTESSHKYVTASGAVKLDNYSCSGINIGGLVIIPTGKKFELEVGASYSMLGYKDKIYDGVNINDYFYARVKSHYLTIPIAEKFYPFGDGIYVEFGPQIGFLLSKKMSLKDDISDMQLFDSCNNKFLDFGVLGGLGYRFPNNIFLNARYIYGFTETNKIYKGGENRNFQLSLGYLF